MNPDQMMDRGKKMMQEAKEMVNKAKGMMKKPMTDEALSKRIKKITKS